MKDQIEFYEQKLKYELDSWDLLEALKHGENVIVVDTRSIESYQNEHIPGAINIPHLTMTPESTAKLDKNYLYVTYCDGIGCNASTKGALNLTKLGFKIKELQGGINWWKKDGYETDGLKATSNQNIECGCK